jgi:glycosyltransferase involved in cell wall biosynthesis
MKVLFLCSWFREKPDDIGGAFFAEQASVLSERGHDVAIAHCKPRSIRRLMGSKSFRVSENERYAGNTYGSVYRGDLLLIPPRFTRLNEWLRRWEFSRFLGRVYADFGRPDIIHIQSAVVAGVYGADLVRENNIPYVVTEHATSYRRGRVPESNYAPIRECFENAFAAFAVSTALIEDLKRIGVSSNINILPNMYEGELFNLDGVDRNPLFTFLMVCQLNAKKGIDTALDAFAKVHAEAGACRFLIVGDGPDAEKAERQIDALNIRDNVRLLGQQSRESVARLMKESHCIVSASRFETFGVTLVEGLACGLTAIATRSGGPEDFVKPPYGSLVPVDDAEALAVEMIRTIREYDGSDEALRARNEYMKEHYSKEAFYRRISAVYERAVLNEQV